MKAIAYSITPEEKEYLVKSNAKVHDLTLISNILNADTVSYCEGKSVLIVSERDQLDRLLLITLQKMGIRHIVTRSKATSHIDLLATSELGMKVANNPTSDQSVENAARQSIRSLHLWEAGKCVGKACCCQKDCAVNYNEEGSGL